MFVVFCKQKTADGIRISDWSSDVCSSYLHMGFVAGPAPGPSGRRIFVDVAESPGAGFLAHALQEFVGKAAQGRVVQAQRREARRGQRDQNGREWWRERTSQ